MRAYIERVLDQLVRIDSVNPDLVPGAAGERRIAAFVAEEMMVFGCEVRFVGPPQRPSVVATLPGTGRGRSLMLNGHLDTVGVAGMADPFAARVSEGRMFGRGAYDMKASIAAAMGAIYALSASPPAGDVILTAVADEEVASAGTIAVLEKIRTTGAICLEPTSLKTCLAHKGFVWIEVRTQGRAAHGSRFDEGIDANMKMGRFLTRLDRLEAELRARAPHPLLGPPSLHAATLAGGSGWSTYAEECTLRVERRTIPGETIAQVEDEIRALGAESVQIVLAREPFEAPPDAEIVKAVRESGGGEFYGDTPWMDAALLAAAGIETVVIGPHGGGAHTADEWVDLDSTVKLTGILIETARRYCA